jgi:hypothetical protein
MISFDRSQSIALVISIVIESLFVACWGQLYRLNWQSLVIAATGGTLVTHPLLWQIFIALPSSLSFTDRSLLLEPLVAIIEGIVYRLVTGYSWRLCAALSFGANLASYTCGILLQRLQH